MNCREFEHLVEAYIEGNLDADRTSRMDEHTQSCQSCNSVVIALRAVMASLDSADEISAPAGFADRLRARISSEEHENILLFPTDVAAPGHTPVTCDVFGGQVAAFTDGSIDDAFGKRMKAHRKTCAACDQLASAHETVLSALSSAKPVAAPSGFAARVRAAAAQETAVRPVMVPTVTRKLDILVAACVSMMVLSGLFLLTKVRMIPVVSDSGFGASFESFAMNIMSAPLLLKAWIAATIPADQWIMIARLSEPIDIPLLPLRFSPLLYGCAIVAMFTSLAIVRIFDKPAMMVPTQTR